MAFHIAILVLFFLSFLAFQSSKAYLIDEVCSTTPDPNFCESSFRSDSRSAGADLHTLAQVGIDLTKHLAISTSSLIKDLGGKLTNPNIKPLYEACQENYSSASYILNEAVSALKSGDYHTLNIRAGAVLAYSAFCDDNFTGISHLLEPAELKASSMQLQTLGVAIAAIANKLLDH